MGHVGGGAARARERALDGAGAGLVVGDDDFGQRHRLRQQQRRTACPSAVDGPRRRLALALFPSGPARTGVQHPPLAHALRRTVFVVRLVVVGALSLKPQLLLLARRFEPLSPRVHVPPQTALARTVVLGLVNHDGGGRLNDDALDRLGCAPSGTARPEPGPERGCEPAVGERRAAGRRRRCWVGREHAEEAGLAADAGASRTHGDDGAVAGADDDEPDVRHALPCRPYRRPTRLPPLLSLLSLPRPSSSAPSPNANPPTRLRPPHPPNADRRLPVVPEPHARRGGRAHEAFRQGVGR